MRGSLSISVQTLTEAQLGELARCRDRWAAIRTATAPADRPAAEMAVAMSYESAGLRAPKHIAWCRSPVELARVWERARHLRTTGANVRPAVIDAMRDRAASRTWWQLRPDTRKIVFAGIRSAQADAVCAAASQVTLRAVRAGRPSLPTRLRQSLTSFWNRARPSDFEHCSAGPEALDWLAPYEFLHDVCALRQDDGALAGLRRLAANVGWVLPHQHVCWLCDRPSVLAFDALGRLHAAGGPALAYPDGWAVHVWKGVELPAKLIERPDLITLDAIDRQPNIVIRRCMIEIIGTKRFLSLGGAWIAGRDETGVLWRKTWRSGDAWAAVEVENGTAERDGSRQRYILQVPPELPTPRAAVAWTYGMSERDYRALTLRT